MCGFFFFSNLQIKRNIKLHTLTWLVRNPLFCVHDCCFKSILFPYSCSISFLAVQTGWSLCTHHEVICKTLINTMARMQTEAESFLSNSVSKTGRPWGCVNTWHLYMLKIVHIHIINEAMVIRCMNSLSISSALNIYMTPFSWHHKIPLMSRANCFFFWKLYNEREDWQLAALMSTLLLPSCTTDLRKVLCLYLYIFSPFQSTSLSLH